MTVIEKCIEKHNRVLVMMIIFVKLKMEKFLEKHEYMNVIIFQRNTWKENCDVILRDLKEGGLIDGWDDKLDCRGAEHTKPLKEIIGEDNANKVIKLIEGFRDFYRFDHEESSFNFTMYLGCGPTSNPKTVIDYWKSQGVDITIDEKKDLTEDDYWELDMYGHISRK